MEKNKKTLIIVPAYNEENNIAAVIDDVRHYALEADILVVNDGSKDETARVAQHKGVLLLNLLENFGIGVTMQTGYKFAHMRGYDIAVQCDGDGQHPADQIQRLIQPLIKGECDIVVGSRFSDEKSYKSTWARRIGMKVFSFVISAILRQKMTDTTSGFRAANREVIKSLSLYYPCDYPEVESLVLLHQEGFSIKEVPIAMKMRAGGVSSITFRKSIYYMIKVLLAVFLDILRDLPYRKGDRHA